jgi:hypothetical protein
MKVTCISFMVIVLLVLAIAIAGCTNANPSPSTSTQGRGIVPSGIDVARGNDDPGPGEFIVSPGRFDNRRGVCV